jgi:hypothetical protein
VLSGGIIDGPVPVVVSIMSSLTSKIEDKSRVVSKYSEEVTFIRLNCEFLVVVIGSTSREVVSLSLANFSSHTFSSLLVFNDKRSVNGNLTNREGLSLIFSSEGLRSRLNNRHRLRDGLRSRDYDRLNSRVFSGLNNRREDSSGGISRVEGEKLVVVVVATALINNISLRVGSAFVSFLVNKFEVLSINSGHSEVLSGGIIDGPVPVVVSIMSSLTSKIEDESSVV